MSIWIEPASFATTGAGYAAGLRMDAFDWTASGGPIDAPRYVPIGSVRFYENAVLTTSKREGA